MLSLVIPCYNEAEVLALTYGALVEAATDWHEPVEIILVDDGSTDETWSIIESLARRDTRVRGIRLARNFGHQAALGAGLEVARGDAVVTLDADLQDPPNLIEQMMARWRQGYEIVYAQRTRRHGESMFKKVAGHLFYRLLDRVNTVSMPRNTGDFALFDARVVRILRQFREHALFWRGLRCWSGFRQTAVYFDRPGRARGKTKYTLRKLVKLASDGLLSFSPLPLRLAFYAGTLVLVGTLLTTLGAALWRLGVPGVTPWPISPAVFAAFYLGSVQLICLGIIGEYLNRIYDEVRDRPRWIVDKTLGMTEAEASKSDEQRPRLAG